MARTDNLLHDFFLLVGLNRVGWDIISLIVKFFDGSAKGIDQLLNLTVKDLGEAQGWKTIDSNRKGFANAADPTWGIWENRDI